MNWQNIWLPEVILFACGETAKLDLPNTTMKNVHRGMVDGIDVIQIALPYSNKGMASPKGHGLS